MKFGDYPKAGSLDGVTGFRNYMQTLGLDMPCDDIVAGGPTSPLAQPIEVDGMKIGHRLAIQPMEGWDCERDGRPSDNTKRRWRRFGLSGAELLWGGEACAVRPDGRANPKQLTMTADSQRDIAGLREISIAAHKEATGNDDNLVIGLQLYLSRTFIGRAIMAVAQDQQALRLLSVDPIRIKRIAFGISIATCALAGAFLIIIQPVEPSIGRDYIGRIFAICVLGGMTSFPGMVLAAMLIGIVESITATFYGPSWAPAIAFGFLLITLAVRPAGLLGR